MCWGSGSSGQLGNGALEDSPTPVEVTELADATALALGRRHACALRKTGHVVCWGRNGEGQLGDGSGSPERSIVPRPVQVRGLTDAVKIAAIRELVNIDD